MRRNNMKVVIEEFETSFGIELVPESREDDLKLLRLGMRAFAINKGGIDTWVNKQGISCYIDLPAKKADYGLHVAKKQGIIMKINRRQISIPMTPELAASGGYEHIAIPKNKHEEEIMDELKQIREALEDRPDSFDCGCDRCRHHRAAMAALLRLEAEQGEATKGTRELDEDLKTIDEYIKCPGVERHRRAIGAIFRLKKAWIASRPQPKTKEVPMAMLFDLFNGSGRTEEVARKIVAHYGFTVKE
jgi:hypothetical protein